ncbi:MAG: hypothetical protein Athens071426_138 [Parcubacteria group bacterium Athens0714_26]|nr:MAG: hypothetical protein Athens101426_66 [Parcubacteria group bacterium Athens1014_26]TSD03649.1 MAG: hypothetical protein Athens071426_138 [Parcubacteria group bacterium Athens0714_26]
MISAENVKLVVSLLGEFDSQCPLPADVFHAVERITALTAIETVFLKKNQDKIEVLLLSRPGLSEDPYYGDKLNSPGSMLRGSDAPLFVEALGLCDQEVMEETAIYEKPFRRILKCELGIKQFGAKPKFVGTMLYLTSRGLEHVVIFLCVARKEDSPRGAWYNVESLPKNLVEHHHLLIKKATDYFKVLKVKS